MGIDATLFAAFSDAALQNSEIREAQHKLYVLFGPALLGSPPFLRRLDKRQANAWGFTEANQTLLETSCLGRHYGPGYERGDFRLIHDVAEALEVVFQGQTPRVWYGADVCQTATPFGAAERAALRRHWLRGEQPYYDNRERGEVCSVCEVPMWKSGPTYRLTYRCACGEMLVISDEGTKRTSHEERKLEEIRKCVYGKRGEDS